MNAWSHRRWTRWLPEYRLGHLDARRQTAVAAHLERCAACRADLAQQTALAAVLQRADPAAPVPPVDSARWRALAAGAPAPARPARAGSLGRWATAGALGALLFAGGLVSGRTVFAPDPPAPQIVVREVPVTVEVPVEVPVERIVTRTVVERVEVPVTRIVYRPAARRGSPPVRATQVAAAAPVDGVPLPTPAPAAVAGSTQAVATADGVSFAAATEAAEARPSSLSF